MRAFVLPARKSRPYEGPECPGCTSTLPATAAAGGTTTCAHCRLTFEATSFERARVLPRAVASVETAGPDGAMPCANHAGNSAEKSCARCGAFICGLCRVDLERRTLCTECFDRQSDDGSLMSTVSTTRDWRAQAVSCVTLGVLFIFIGPVCGAAAIYYSVMGLKLKKAAGETNELTALRVTLVLGVLLVLGGLALDVLLLLQLTG